MSTGAFENWAGDITEIGAIYPFVGSEGLLVVLGLAFWIGWHVIQLTQEKSEYEHDQSDVSKEEMEKRLIQEESPD